VARRDLRVLVTAVSRELLRSRRLAGGERWRPSWYPVTVRLVAASLIEGLDQRLEGDPTS
jgi:hypothetical protein